MPITTSAKKKLRQDKNRQITNLVQKRQVKEAMKKFRESPSEKLLSESFSVLDTAKKKKIFHPSKVNRLKSSLAKLLNKKGSKPRLKETATKKKRQKKSR